MKNNIPKLMPMNTFLRIFLICGFLILAAVGMAVATGYRISDTLPWKTGALEVNGDINAMGNAITNASFDESSQTSVQNSTKNGVHITDFGAIPNDGISDSDAIEAAINSVDGGTIFFPIGNTSISKPIVIKRGITLAGIGVAEPSYRGSQVVLMDNSNCDLVQTPAGASGSISDATHYMGIRDLAFDGNMRHQDTENLGIKFWGTYVTSYIDRIVIYNVKGVALSLKFSPDINIGSVWITRVNTSTAAIEINRDYSGVGGYVYFEDLWVESVMKTSSSEAYNLNENQRASAIYSKGLRLLHIANLHSEYTGDTIILNNTKILKIGMLKTHQTGTNESKTGVVNLADEDVYMVDIGPAYLESPTTNFTLISKKSSYGPTNITETSIVKNVDGSQYYVGYIGNLQQYITSLILPDTTNYGLRIIKNSSNALLVKKSTGEDVFKVNTLINQVLLNGTFQKDSSLKLTATSHRVGGYFGRFNTEHKTTSGSQYYTYLSNGAIHKPNGTYINFTIENQYVDGTIILLNSEGFSFLFANAPTDNKNMLATQIAKIKQNGELILGNGTKQTNITLTAPSGNEGCCGMNNSYHITCKAGACS